MNSLGSWSASFRFEFCWSQRNRRNRYELNESSNITSMENSFRNTTNLKTINLDNLKINRCTNMNNMFMWSTNLETVKIGIKENNT